MSPNPLLMALCLSALAPLLGSASALPEARRPPRLRLGIRATTHNTTFSTTYYDTALSWAYRTTHDDPFWGVGIEVEYGPLALLRFRLDLADARWYRAGGGALALFPAVGVDVFCEPPTRWRLLPYLWAGGQMTRYVGSQSGPDTLDLRFMTGFERHLRAGVGGRFALDRRTDLFCEVQVFSEDTYPVVDVAGSRAGHWVAGFIGINQVHLGVRTALWD